MNRGLDRRRIGIGTAIMFGLNLIASFILPPSLGGAPTAEAAVASGGGRLSLAAAVSFLGFAVGGRIVGARSPGGPWRNRAPWPRSPWRSAC